MVWFEKVEPTEEEVRAFIETLEPASDGNLTALFLPSHHQWCQFIGNVGMERSKYCGEFVVAGSGANIFRDVTADLAIHNAPPDIEGLRLANFLMGRETWYGEPLQHAFGGAYEIVFSGQTHYERVDDVLYVFAHTTMNGASPPTLRVLPHIIRQWYEGTHLCVASVVAQELEARGEHSYLFDIPPVNEEPCERTVDLASLPNRPQYVCIHNVAQIGDFTEARPLTLKGSDIDRYVSFRPQDGEIRIELSEEYHAALRRWAEGRPFDGYDSGPITETGSTGRPL